MCHNELGPGTQYGRLAVRPPLHLKAVCRGSVFLMASRSLCRETLYPIPLSHPMTIVSPNSGCPTLISFKSVRNCVSLGMFLGSFTNPYSTLLLYIVILETPSQNKPSNEGCRTSYQWTHGAFLLEQNSCNSPLPPSSSLVPRLSYQRRRGVDEAWYPLHCPGL